MANSRKRGQNEGSIYQRSDGRYAAALSLGVGRRKYVYARTAAACLKKLDTLRRDLADGRQPTDGRVTVGDLCREWLEIKKSSVRAKTFDAYDGLIRRHVVPEFGIVRVAGLTPARVEAFLHGRQAKISPKTIRNLAWVLKAVFAWGVKRGRMANNPLAEISRGDLPKVERREMSLLSPDQSRALLMAAKNTKSEALVVLLLSCGPRIGEATAITWDKVDLEHGRVRITHGLQFINGEPRLVPPKTRSAIRELVLPMTTLEALRTHRARQNEIALRLGKAWSNKLNLVFTDVQGMPLNRHEVLRQYLRPLLTKAGLPTNLRVHDLRHACASLLIHNNVPIPIVSQMLGHANPSITMAIYVKALPNSQAVAASAMEKLLSTAAV